MAELILAHVVGTADEIKNGRGERAVTAVQAAAQLGLSLTRFRDYVTTGAITPCTRFAKADLFRLSDVESLWRNINA